MCPQELEIEYNQIHYNGLSVGMNRTEPYYQLLHGLQEYISVCGNLKTYQYYDTGIACGMWTTIRIDNGTILKHEFYKAGICFKNIWYNQSSDDGGTM